MPNKAISWTQVPVAAGELLAIHYDRVTAGSQNRLTVHYEVKDSLGAVRQINSISQLVGAYPVTLATILASINAQEGT